MPALPPRDVGKMPGGYNQHYGQQGMGWSGVGGGRSGMEMPNLQTLGLGGGGGGTHSQGGQGLSNPMGLGALNLGMPVNPAMVAAALNQVRIFSYIVHVSLQSFKEYYIFVGRLGFGW